MPFAKLKVRLDGPTGKNATAIELNGVDIREFLKELSIEFAPDRLNVAKLTIMVDELDLDAETMAVLQAHVASREEPSPPEPAVTIIEYLVDVEESPVTRIDVPRGVSTLAERLPFRLRFWQH